MASKSYKVGPNTPEVPLSLFADNRKRLVERLKARKDLPANAVVFMQGGKSETRYDSDHEPMFRQESYFSWAFGVREPDFYGIIDVASGKSILVSPKLPDAYAVWMGSIPSREEIQATYGVDAVAYHEEAADTISKLAEGGKPTLLILDGLNTDSKKRSIPLDYDTVPGVEAFDVNRDILHAEITECRVFKSDAEIEVMRSLNKISSRGHIEAMRAVKPGMGEFQLEATFRYYTYYNGGCRITSYTPIVGSGKNCAVLHYGHSGAPNDKVIEDGDMLLLDMGAEYYCYASDITCSYPANGKFTENQRIIYEAVLKSNRAVFNGCKPGASYIELQRLTDRIHLEELKKAGIVVGDVDEMMKHFIGSLFMPHGLGHHLGLDTHDVGGYPNGMQRVNEPGLSSLRLGRKLEAGMVITIEPGIYFIQSVLEPALADPVKSKFLNADKIAEFMNFGGVRIEDNVVIRETGAENLTNVPRDVKDIEEVMAGKEW